jgi:hypothetical protein
MKFIKLKTSDGDVRWINLEQVSRVTMGTESQDVPFVAILFADGNVEESLKIRGIDEDNQQAIKMLVEALDRLSGDR